MSLFLIKHHSVKPYGKVEIQLHALLPSAIVFCNIFFLKSSRLALEMGIGAVSLGLEQLRRETDCLCPFNAKIKNMLSCFNYNQLRVFSL